MSSMPLYKRIQDDIKAQIATHVLREGDRIPSESEMMKHYFVSSITVKNALNGLVDEGLIYRLKGKGSFVAYNPFEPPRVDGCLPGYTIGVIFATLSTRVQQLHLMNIERECSERNSRLMLGITRESPEREIFLTQDFVQNGCQGLILDPSVSEINNAMVRQFVARHFPFVFLDRYLPEISASRVVADNEGGAREAAQYLIEKHGGDVAIFHFPLYNNAVCDRHRAFSEALTDAGFAFAAANACNIDDTGLFYSSAQERLALLFEEISSHLRKYPELRGFFAANAEIAQVTYLALRQLGRTPGVDCTLVSFDNAYLPGVDYVQQDHRAMVHEAMDLLWAQLGGDFMPKSVVVPAQLKRAPFFSDEAMDMQYIVMGLNP